MISGCKFLLAGLVAAGLAVTGCGAGDEGKRTVVVYAYTAMEEVLMKEIVPTFQREWREKTGLEVEIISAFAGSGTITNSILFGAPAQVAIVATEMDALNLREAGLVTTEWEQFKDRGTFAYTITSIVTRPGNPHGVRNFRDLTAEGVEVIYPDPTTSGGAQWAILALYGSELRTSEADGGTADADLGRLLLERLSARTGSLPESARKALTQFGLGYGDALLTYENEALLDISRGRELEMVVPRSTVLIDPKVVIIDKNVDERDGAMVRALVESLWSKTSQEALARNHFRVRDEEVMAAHGEKFSQVELPFTVEYLGGWQEATSGIINRTWKDAQRVSK